MKKIFILLITIVLFGCTRENPNDTQQTNSLDREISYDVDGIHFAHAGKASKMVGTPGVLPVTYSFTGISTISNNIVIQLFVDSLTFNDYRIINPGSLFAIKSNDISYQVLLPGDYINFKITSYQNSTVSGNFSGHVSKVLSLNPIVTQPSVITNGKLKDILIQY